MSAPEKVDVLAVLDKHIARNLQRGVAKGSPTDRELRATRAAVAELIEAARPAALEEGVTQDELNRLRTALARVGG